MSVFLPLCCGASHQRAVFSVLPQEGTALSVLRTLADSAAPTLPVAITRKEVMRWEHRLVALPYLTLDVGLLRK